MKSMSDAFDALFSVFVCSVFIIAAIDALYAAAKKKRKEDEENRRRDVYYNRAMQAARGHTRNHNARHEEQSVWRLPNNGVSEYSRRLASDHNIMNLRARGRVPPREPVLVGLRNRRGNNHDRDKRQYNTAEAADRVIFRMQRQGKDPRGTLRAYYNPDYGKWFIGNSREAHGR